MVINRPLAPFGLWGWAWSYTRSFSDRASHRSYRPPNETATFRMADTVPSINRASSNVVCDARSRHSSPCPNGSARTRYFMRRSSLAACSAAACDGKRRWWSTCLGPWKSIPPCRRASKACWSTAESSRAGPREAGSTSSSSSGFAETMAIVAPSGREISMRSQLSRGPSITTPIAPEGTPSPRKRSVATRTVSYGLNLDAMIFDANC